MKRVGGEGGVDISKYLGTWVRVPNLGTRYWVIIKAVWRHMK